MFMKCFDDDLFQKVVYYPDVAIGCHGNGGSVFVYAAFARVSSRGS